VYDAIKEPLCYIYGPNICGCCMYKEAQFQVNEIISVWNLLMSR